MLRLELARVLSAPRALDAVFRARSRLSLTPLTALTYHRVVAREELGDDTALGVVDATLDLFEAQLDALAGLGTFVTASEVEAWTRGAALPSSPILITFDDGYLECATRVLPVLVRRGVPATFFVSPAYLDERRLFWWERLARVARGVGDGVVELAYPSGLRLDTRDRSEFLRTVESIVKRRAGLDVPRFVEAVERAAGLELSHEDEERAVARTMMNWDDVGALVRAGMDVQSHTNSHRVLETLSPTALLRELHDSRSRLEARLERPVLTVAYPVGYPVGHLDHVQDALVASGYRLGFTNHTGTSLLRRSSDRFGLRRIAMTTAYGSDVIRGFAAVPGLAPTRSRRASSRQGFVAPR
jgi:peptidoglycan/xylan/chitin deacetylase (PgdA/CDA1 family)